MSAWAWILLACGIAFATKFIGYLVPQSVLDRPFVRQATTLSTVGLLTALVVTNTFADGPALTLDARVVALVAAAVALVLRAPFLLVVVIGAAAAALARLAGMP
ncbi:MAG: AzlD domain-containing protein [Mobilicoccus sp.]|nr:AzlD domain-containing protein [Mobilicoccus sp.]